MRPFSGAPRRHEGSCQLARLGVHHRAEVAPSTLRAAATLSGSALASRSPPRHHSLRRKDSASRDSDYLSRPRIRVMLENRPLLGLRGRAHRGCACCRAPSPRPAPASAPPGVSRVASATSADRWRRPPPSPAAGTPRSAGSRSSAPPTAAGTFTVPRYSLSTMQLAVALEDVQLDERRAGSLRRRQPEALHQRDARVLLDDLAGSARWAARSRWACDSASSSVTASMLPERVAPAAPRPAPRTRPGARPCAAACRSARAIFCCTSGMRLWPPTRITSSMSDARDALLRQHPVADLEGAVHQVAGERVELLAGERDAQVHRLALALLDVGQLDHHVGDAA